MYGIREIYNYITCSQNSINMTRDRSRFPYLINSISGAGNVMALINALLLSQSDINTLVFPSVRFSATECIVLSNTVPELLFIPSCTVALLFCNSFQRHAI